MSEQADWEDVRELESRVQRGEPLSLTDAESELLRRAARQVAISDDVVERGLRSPGDAASLVTEIRRRIREGSRRLSRAIMEADRHADAGDADKAREVLEGVLAAEVVPLYLEILRTKLGALD